MNIEYIKLQGKFNFFKYKKKDSVVDLGLKQAFLYNNIQYY